MTNVLLSSMNSSHVLISIPSMLNLKASEIVVENFASTPKTALSICLIKCVAILTKLKLNLLKSERCSLIFHFVSAFLSAGMVGGGIAGI